MNISVVDLRMGNIFNLERAINFVGGSASFVRKKLSQWKVERLKKPGMY